jgi:flagellar assembly protein FliH
LYKIFHSECGVEFKNVRFQDLETIRKKNSSFFVPKFPVDFGKGKREPGTEAETTKTTTTDKKKDLPPEKSVNIEVIREEAYAKGKVAGHLEAEEKLHLATQALGSGLEQISCLRKSLLTKSKEDMIRLIMAVVKQVIQTEVEENKSIIVKTVTKTLEAAVPADQYYIRVHPEDLKIVTEKESLFLAGMKGLKNISFRADETISRGGCIAESQAGEVDATINSQLTEIYEHLRKEIL